MIEFLITTNNIHSIHKDGKLNPKLSLEFVVRGERATKARLLARNLRGGEVILH
ncbi:MAG: hypothetical protein IPF46_07240 [Saprospiraceae bacterium]|nr:hypothetical protein [Candidatus Vicinibacter affinis]